MPKLLFIDLMHIMYFTFKMLLKETLTVALYNFFQTLSTLLLTNLFSIFIEQRIAITKVYFDTSEMHNY